MADFIITGPDGKRYKVSGDSAEGAVAALKKMLGQAAPQAQQQPKENVIATTKDGGRVIRMSSGQLAFASPAYSTTDQDAIARIMEGATPAEESTASFDRQTIAQHPIAARGAKFVQGVPFAGEYADEAIGAVYGDKAQQAVRASQSAMDRQNPIESTALGIAGGVVGSVPAIVAAAPAVAAAVPANLAAQMTYGALGGIVAGGVEGAVSGYGAGNDGNRGMSAAKRGAMGAGLGGIIGGLAPAVGRGVSDIYRRFKGSDVKVIAQQLGISDDAARVVKQHIEGDDLAAAQAAIARGGDKAMLADAGPGTQQLLDASVFYGRKAPGMVRDAVEERARQGGKDMQAALDTTLGRPGATTSTDVVLYNPSFAAKQAADVPREADGWVRPSGIEAMQREISRGTAKARSAAYDAAYAQPIDYSGGHGKVLESLFKRVPASAWRRAEELMRLEGVQSKQVLAEIADDGTVSLSSLPDVRQIDYLTRALNDVADAADGQGKLGGTTALGRATKDLSRNIRTTLRGAVPEYAKALDTAGDAIGRKEASDLGYSLMRAGTTRETVLEGMRDASKAEIAAAKAGVRQYIDDTLANVRASITSPDLDINEFRKLTGDLRSRAVRDKLTMVMGKRDADALYAALDKEVTSLELRASLATNSKTEARGAVRRSVDAVKEPGPFRTLQAVKPIEAARRLGQELTGATEEALAAEKAALYDEIARALVSKRGADAQLALGLINQARKGQPLTDKQAQLISRAAGSAFALGGYQTANQSLSTWSRGPGK